MDLNITLADVLTPAGFVAAAALVTGLVEIAKRLFRHLSGNEATAAAILAALLVCSAYYDAHVFTLQTGFVAVIAWYGITRLAMGIHDDATAAPNSLTGGPAASPQG
jgi:hypothetical protein